MQLAASGKLLAVTNNGQSTQTVHLIDPVSEKVLDEQVIKKSWYGLAFSPTADKLYVSGGNDNIILAYPVADRKLGAADTLRLGKPWPVRISPVGLAFDAARPLFGCLQATPTGTPYQAKAAQVPLDTRNTAWSHSAERSQYFNLATEDAAPDLDLTKVVWKSVRGEDAVVPAPRRGAFLRPPPKRKNDDD